MRYCEPLGLQMRGLLDSFPPSGNGVIARRKIRKAFAEARISRLFSKPFVVRREAAEIVGKAHRWLSHYRSRRTILCTFIAMHSREKLAGPLGCAG
jgi:hypothetical protein